MSFPQMAPGPASRGLAVTKSDTVPLPRPTSGLWVGGVGDVTVVFANDALDDPVTFTAVAAGTFLPFSVLYVMAATTATLIVAVF